MNQIVSSIKKKKQNKPKILLEIGEESILYNNYNKIRNPYISS